jgi:hypothetical protein
MDRRSVVSLAAVIVSGLSVSGCLEPPRNDGQMFQRWAQAVAEIPTSDEEAAARDLNRARATLAQASARAPEPSGPAIVLTSEAAGLRPQMTINVVDALELPNARDLGLRGSLNVNGAPARFQRASMTAPAPTASTGPPAAGHVARIAAFHTRADAEKTWRRLRAAHADLLAGVSPRFETVDLGAKGTWVRLMTSPLPSRDAAAEVCRAAGVTDRWCAAG